MKRAAQLLAVAAAVLLPACGGDDGPIAAETTPVKVYFLLDDKVWPVRRDVDAADPLNAAYQALLAGPSQDEQELGFTTAVPPEPKDEDLSDAALAQMVYTATQFPPGRAEVEGVSYTRADFEDQTPPVLVESPLPFEEVSSPLRAEGTANTFEATFNYTLTDTDGLIVDENFVTATSGTGTRGTFEFTTEPYAIPFDGIGSLIVFERSAEDGSKIHIVEIPLRMSK